MLVDVGIRRGTDVVKALYLGTRRVGIGRAALFVLGTGGAAGVERTLESKASKKTCFSVSYRYKSTLLDKKIHRLPCDF